MQRQVQANKDVSVIYIGNKEKKHEKTYGTRLVFTRGQCHDVVSPIAMQMLKHASVYTTFGTPELEAFVKDNPQIAAQKGLVELSPDELDALIRKAEANTPPPPEEPEDDDITIDVNGGQNALDETHLEEVKSDIEACVNKGQLQEWGEARGLNVSYSGTRAEIEARLLDAYKAINVDA